MLPTLDWILDITWDVFGVPRTAILSPSRGRQHTAFARQVAMYLHWKFESRCLSATGRAFKRDHTTVHFAVVKIQRNLNDPKVKQAVKLAYERATPSV